jgi:hypothetical protein
MSYPTSFRENFLAAAGEVRAPLNLFQTGKLDIMKQAATRVVHSFFEFGLSCPMSTPKNTAAVVATFEIRWEEFCGCSKFYHKDITHQVSIWDTLHEHQTFNNQLPSHLTHKADLITTLIIQNFPMDLMTAPDGISPLLFALRTHCSHETISAMCDRGGTFLPTEGSEAMIVIAQSSHEVITAVTTAGWIANSPVATGTVLHYVCATRYDTNEILQKVVALIRMGVEPSVINSFNKSACDILKERFAGGKYDANIREAVRCLSF